MSKEIFLPYGVTGLTTLYATIRRPSDGFLWYTVTPVFEAYNAAHVATGYAILLAEEGTSGDYYADFPAGIAATGKYEVIARKQTAGSPAWPTDPVVATGTLDWSGAALCVPVVASATGTTTVSANSDKTGYSLSATGLDAITTTEPDTTANGAMSTWNFRLLLRWLVMAMAGGSRTLSGGSGNLLVKKLAGTTSTTQAITDDGLGNETLGEPS